MRDRRVRVERSPWKKTGRKDLGDVEKQRMLFGQVIRLLESQSAGGFKKLGDGMVV